ncbi:16S rRNA (cytosine(1402)-N(4))-methyltransferase RsmH [Flaviflexus equikiangi]|uniref:Ribosomal RNA small subunit methyltransferase H n=1 Tax=Flaviflexus equikiangi TaxID=2758573 RepID=A0ABS2TER9_9ACTO|nr:16S rRNA (cytosine(1402)-N(4))-methyltransferase RsmH [Flaviflexus equikiangi]MBM9433148.1 16S rRNA (cytosine(1402)-N(4))-methyltransferase RsmH [Flaviflexus equikiangi]
MSAADLHIPVLVDTCMELLAPALHGPAILFDATLGMGGHTEAALQRFPELTVVGIDRDPAAIRLASERLAPFGDRFRAEHAEYDAMDDIAKKHGRPNGILMDLGVSSLQLDDASRGFAYSQDAPLDMRMDTSQGRTAADLIAQSTHGELARIISLYGEEKFAGRIATKIVHHPDRAAITTAELAELVKSAIPAAARRTGGNPAKRTFQALRIAVNDELGILERAIPRAMEVLEVGGRLVVESYHSLEDRIVKRAMQGSSTSTTPMGVPVQMDSPPFTLITKRAIQADEAEIAANPRSASVRVRACEKQHEGRRL